MPFPGIKKKKNVSRKIKSGPIEAKLLDAKKLVWSQVNPKLHRAALLPRESQTSCGDVRTFGLLGFEFKFGFFYKHFCLIMHISYTTFS
jgi:hypothetical protein